MKEVQALVHTDQRPTADLEGQTGKLAMQEHVLQGSLALSQEQLASVSMIENAMQDAVSKLSLFEARQLMLHIASQLAEVQGQHNSSQLMVSSLQSNLQAADQLNQQLKQRVWQLSEQLSNAQEERARSVAALLRRNEEAPATVPLRSTGGGHLQFELLIEIKVVDKAGRAGHAAPLS
jgi:superfamily II helicase